jgi:hypothetical protein
MSTRQRSDKAANYKASFIYITPSILVKISFILGRMVQNILIGIWITSQAGVWGVCPLQIEKIRFLHEILIPKQFLASLSPPLQSLIYIHNSQHSCQNKFHIGPYINNTNSLQKSSKYSIFDKPKTAEL